MGLFLDLEEGTLVVYNNGVCVGEIKNGLSGKYCWMVNIFVGPHFGEGVSIKWEPIPVDHAM